MRIGYGDQARSLFLVLACLGIALLAAPMAKALSGASWSGVLRDAAGSPAGDATVRLRITSGEHDYTARTSSGGKFVFSGLVAGNYELSVTAVGKTYNTANPVIVQDGTILTMALRLSSEGQVLHVLPSGGDSTPQASGGEHLSGTEVSSLPLNARDFSKLLLLAAGTMTDANGAANFTQQFAMNGQRGSATVFAIDGFDTTDPEMGGATFSNFNVDAIQEVQASSGVIPAEMGHGAASFTTVESKANFMSSAREGELVTGEATPLHLGSTTQVWDATVTNETTGRHMAAYRCTQLILYPRLA